MNYFTTNQLSKHIYSITDLSMTHSFLVVGSDRAALIDTGTGVGDLYGYIQEMTDLKDLPLIVLGTHGHLDHMGGSDGFDMVYLNEKDLDIAREITVEERVGYTRQMQETVRQFQPEAWTEIHEEDFLPVRTRPYVLLKDGAEFDLGGITVQALPFPGHTQGSMVMLFKEERSIILGDACNTNVFLFFDHSSSVSAYKRTMEAFRDKYSAMYDTVYLSHGPEIVAKSVLDDCIELCDEILAGTDDKIPFDFNGTEAMQAKATSGWGARADGKVGNIVYNPNKLRDDDAL